jgi:hypothetical protein
MRKTLPLLCLTLLAFALAACGGDDDGGAAQAVEIFFAPDKADASAHAALPDVADLPGEGWTVVARDDFSEGDDEDDLDFEAFAAGEPSCAAMNNLAEFASVFGDDEDDPPAGHAQIEFERSLDDTFVPSSIEVDVEIQSSVADVEGVWQLVKGILESGDMQNCFIALFNDQFKDLTEESGFKIEVTSTQATSTPPRGGSSMAFNINMELDDFVADIEMQMYLWPYGNAGVTLMFLGDAKMLDQALTDEVVKTVDGKLEAAAQSQ